MHNSVSDSENYFSREKLSEILQIDSHIAFVEDIVEKYSLPDAQKAEIKSDLEKIKKKQSDRMLNMSVIGEFSSGKSTFINSLLRSELLASCSLQGTTVANTVIEHSNRFALRMNSKDGTSREIEVSSVSELAAALESATADDESAKNISTLNVFLPAEYLGSDFRIIDTPGTNALELWHEDVTKTAMQEISDLSVILMDAAKPFPETLCNFVNANLENVLRQCVFVLTKFDTIPKMERKMMLAYAENKAKTVFGIENPIVLPYSSTAILDGDVNSEMYAQSMESEAKLVSHMARERSMALSKKMIALTDNLYNGIVSEMESIASDCNVKLDILEKTKREDFSDFLASQKELRKAEFVQKAVAEKGKIAKEIFQKYCRAVSSVETRIQSIQSKFEVQEYLQNYLQKHCSYAIQDITNHVSTRIAAIDEIRYEEMKNFHSELLSAFEKLEIGSLISEEKISLKIIPTVSVSYGMNMENVRTKLVMQSYNGMNSIFGGLFAPSLAAVKQSVLAQLDAPLRNYFISAVQDISLGLDRYVESIASNMKLEIDNCYNSYQTQISEEIEREKERKKELEKKKNSMALGIVEIENRKFALSSVNRQIAILEGKEMQ